MTDDPKTIPPPDWAEDWGRIPYDPNAERAAFNATSRPRDMSPQDFSRQTSPPANTSGWQSERGLGPQPGIDLIDRMCIAADQRERAQAQQPDFAAMLMTMQQTQNLMMQALAALMLRLEAKK
jgi:hypothetical protein